LGAGRSDNLLNAGSKESVELTQKKLQELKARIGMPETSAVETKSGLSFLQKMMRIAAVLTGLALLGTGEYYYFIKPKQQQLVKQSVASKPHEPSAHYNRYITLSDGSTVILHAGSKLDYPVSFNGNAREVSLTGEGYFDVQHNDKPFIIHTGNVKTTVLGTAFNIKAYAGEKNIVISVTRGKVKVEDEKKLLAVLNPDEQVVYHIPASSAEQMEVKTAAVVSWIKEDMVFEAASFASIAEVLSRRYQVNISFRNPALEQCLITASFSGMESLEKILTYLCTVRNASYIMENGKIVIEGHGCE
jgi:ferric-dicitrate binding protein FerR (iron transport regulator)